MLQSYLGIMVPKSAFCYKNSELENFFCKNVIGEYGVMDKIDYVVTDNGSKREERSMKTWKKTVMLRTKRTLQMTTLKVMLDRSKEFILMV